MFAGFSGAQPTLGWVSQLDLGWSKRERVLPLGSPVPCIPSIFLNTLQDGHNLQPHCASEGAESRAVELFMEAAQLGSICALVGGSRAQLSVLPSAASPGHHFQAPLLEDLWNSRALAFLHDFRFCVSLKL